MKFRRERVKRTFTIILLPFWLQIIDNPTLSVIHLPSSIIWLFCTYVLHNEDKIFTKYIHSDFSLRSNPSLKNGTWILLRVPATLFVFVKNGEGGEVLQWCYLWISLISTSNKRMKKIPLSYPEQFSLWFDEHVF